MSITSIRFYKLISIFEIENNVYLKTFFFILKILLTLPKITHTYLKHDKSPTGDHPSLLHSIFC